MELKKVKRSQVKLKMGLSGTSGSGKTYSALLLAHGITDDWNKIAVIDTENKSAALYSHLGDFWHLPLEAPYSPERYVEAIKACEKSGVEVCIIDSITHEWDGSGGIIEISNSMTGNSFANWAKITPRHNNFINAILQSQMHIITCVRRKQDYEMTKDSNGKIKVEKAGLKEVTRENWEYELSLNMTIEMNHMASASKDRTRLFVDKPEFIITEQTGKTILNWCNEGELAPLSLKEQYKKMLVDNTNLLSEGDYDKFTAGIEGWDNEKVAKAMTRLEEIFKERKEAYYAQEVEKGKQLQSKLNQQ